MRSCVLALSPSQSLKSTKDGACRLHLTVWNNQNFFNLGENFSKALSRCLALSRYDKDWNTPTIIDIMDAKIMMLSQFYILKCGVLLRLSRYAGRIVVVDQIFAQVSLEHPSTLHRYMKVALRQFLLYR